MKVCSKCSVEKEEKEFRFKNKELNILHAHCKLCACIYGNAFYKRNRKERIAVSAKRVPIVRLRDTKFIVEYLFSHPCIDCGESDPLVLDFDHVKGNKYKNITSMLGIYSQENILKEIDKCAVRCSNCHRRKTAKQCNWKKIQVIEEFMRRKPID